MSKPSKRFFVGQGKGYLNAAGSQFRFILFLLLLLACFTLLLLVFQKLAGFMPFFIFLPISLVTIILFIGAAGAIYSHKFSGPVIRIRKTIDRMAEGEVSVSLRLRDGDDPMLKELADAVCRLGEHSRNTHAQIESAVHELFGGLAALREKIHLGAAKAEMQQQIDELREKQEALEKVLHLYRKS